jgi:hypothetical protein
MGLDYCANVNNNTKIDEPQKWGSFFYHKLMKNVQNIETTRAEQQVRLRSLFSASYFYFFYYWKKRGLLCAY